MLREDLGGGATYNDDERHALLNVGNGRIPTGYTTSQPMAPLQQMVCLFCSGSISSRSESPVI
jgi:hypothetical protein